MRVECTGGVIDEAERGDGAGAAKGVGDPWAGPNFWCSFASLVASLVERCGGWCW